jgi:hypothetical protein
MITYDVYKRNIALKYLNKQVTGCQSCQNCHGIVVESTCLCMLVGHSEFILGQAARCQKHHRRSFHHQAVSTTVNILFITVNSLVLEGQWKCDVY